MSQEASCIKVSLWFSPTRRDWANLAIMVYGFYKSDFSFSSLHIPLAIALKQTELKVIAHQIR